MPLEVVQDYRAVLEGEALAIRRAQKSNVPDAPGFEEEFVTETIQFKVSDA